MFLSDFSLKIKFNIMMVITMVGFLLTLGLTSSSLYHFNKDYENFSKIGVEIQSRTLMVARDQNFLSRLIRSVYLGENMAENAEAMAKSAASVRANYQALAETAQRASATRHTAQATSEQTSTVEEVSRTAHDLAQVAESLSAQTRRFRL